MPTFRPIVAVGVGAAIALSFIEPSASKDLPAIAQPRRDQAESPDSQPIATPTQNNLTQSSKDSRAESAAKQEDNSTSMTGELSKPNAISTEQRQKAPQEPIRNLFIRSELSKPNATSAEERHKPDEPIRNLFLPSELSKPNATSAEERHKPEEPTVNSSTQPELGKPEATSTEERHKPDEESPVNSSTQPELGKPDVTSSSDRIKPTEQNRRNSALSSPPDSGAPQAMPTSVKDYLGKAFSPLGEDSFVQAPTTGTPGSSPGTLGSQAPEYLNPSANPLLFPTRSQEVQIQNTQPITLQEAIELARRNNLQLQQTQLTLERSRAQLRQAEAALYPVLDLQTGLINSQSGQSGGGGNLDNLINSLPPLLAPLGPLFNQLAGGGDGGDNTSTNFSGSLQVNYDIYTGGQRNAQIRAAEEGIRLQQLQVEQVSEQLRLDTTSAYYNLQEAGAQVEIAQAAVADAAQSLRDAQLREQAGLGTRFDVLQAQVQLAAANQDLTTAISQLRTARRQVVQVLNLAQTVDVAASDPIEVAGEWNLSLEQSIVLALKNRAELEAQLVQRNISEQNRRAALASIRPQVGISASYNINNQLNDNAGFRDSYSIGPTIRWRLFDAGEARARANQERRNIEIAETNFANQRNQVRFDVEQSFFDLNANAQNIQTASFALTQAQESLRLARLRFQAGVGTQTDVIQQQTELTRARGRLLTAILNYNRALAQLQRSVSNLPESNLFDLP
jgi:outer membrane protein TolC